jgi:hypothetical protein
LPRAGVNSRVPSTLSLWMREDIYKALFMGYLEEK